MGNGSVDRFGFKYEIENAISTLMAQAGEEGGKLVKPAEGTVGFLDSKSFQTAIRAAKDLRAGASAAGDLSAHLHPIG